MWTACIKLCQRYVKDKNVKPIYSRVWNMTSQWNEDEIQTTWTVTSVQGHEWECEGNLVGYSGTEPFACIHCGTWGHFWNRGSRERKRGMDDDSCIQGLQGRGRVPGTLGTTGDEGPETLNLWVRKTVKPDSRGWLIWLGLDLRSEFSVCHWSRIKLLNVE